MLRKIDSLLRGEFRGDPTASGAAAGLDARSLALLGLVMGATYGVFMGLYAAIRADVPMHVAVAAFKVPLLLFSTLLVTMPSLYVFATLAGARLDLRDVLRLALGTIAIAMTVLASLGPITGFFTLSTESYGFMVLMNVLFFAISGAIGVGFLYNALEKLITVPRAARKRAPSPPLEKKPVEDELHEDPDRELLVRGPRQTGSAGLVLRLWIVMYAIVGAQMSWILRPFIVDPKVDYAIFRDPADSHFFAAAWAVFTGFF